MKLSAAGLSDIGKKRSQNQDHWASEPDLGVLLVADGMGGHQGGETASKLAIEVVLREIRKDIPTSPEPQKINGKAALEMANREVFELAQKEPKLKGMGTTTTLLLTHGDRLRIAHVGDSRAYLLTDRVAPAAIWQLTQDHSLVQEKLRAGLITRSEIKTDRMKNVITRCVGFEPQLTVDLYEYGPQLGDCFLICSDGLCGLVEDQQILALAQKAGLFSGELKSAAQALIDAANERGGDDNITVVLARVESVEEK